MQTARTYTIRQRILQVAKEVAPAPIGIDDLECAPSLRTVRPTREELVNELAFLIVDGFLLAIPESDGDYARISPDGMDQAGPRVEGARAVRIWGKDAL